MKELFTLYYHRRILFTDFFSQSLQNIYLRLDTVVLLPNFEIAFAHISVKGSPIAAL